MFMPCIISGARLNEVNMTATPNINWRARGSAELMMMTIAGISGEFDFMNMATITWNGIARHSCKSMIMRMFTATFNFSAT